MWTEGCVTAVGFRVQMTHRTTFIKRAVIVTWRCFLLWALKLSWDFNYSWSKMSFGDG